MKIRSDTVAERSGGPVVARPTRAELLEALRGIIVEQCGLKLEQVRPNCSLVMDLGIDSLDMVELVMAVEEEFGIAIPETGRNEDPVFQQVFTRPNFSVSDFAELVFLLWGTPCRSEGERPWPLLSRAAEVPIAAFTQLDGIFGENKNRGTEGRTDASPADLFESVELSNVEGHAIHRRQSDGMACVDIPSTVGVKMNGELISIDRFLIDVEPVSTTAYARFLNSIGAVDPDTLELWFALPDWDSRRVHLPLEQTTEYSGAGVWRPRPGGETWPMMLVSWFGANAYALWANGEDWRKFREESPYLPSLIQFEFAARGTDPQIYPWGDDEPNGSLANLARLEFRRKYSFEDLPLSPVNENLGVSPFGLRHMAGNVWHWCRDWRDPLEKKIRCEKGGSWVGPAELARCSHHRGRPPEAKGRCLGFRCVRPMA